MDLSNKQKEILKSKDNKIVVISSAASGKTRVLTEKTRQLLRDGIIPSSIAVITFTNMAANELKERLGNDYKNGMYIGTVHGLANQMLNNSGINTSSLIQDEKFDKFFYLIKQNPRCIKPYDYILLDEAQDSCNEQFEFLFKMVNPNHYFVVGDPKQSIYGFRGSNSKLMMDLVKKDNATLFDLNENYRNGNNILDFAKRLIAPTGLIDNSVSLVKEKGKVSEVNMSYDIIYNFIQNSLSPYKNWAILCRTNTEITATVNFLESSGIPCDSFRQGDLTKDELLKKMQEETVKILTIHSAKGLEWENVIVIGSRFYSDEERNINYVAATRAKTQLVWTRKANNFKRQTKNRKKFDVTKW